MLMFSRHTLAAMRRLALAAFLFPGVIAAQGFDVMEATIPAVHAAMDAKKLTCRQLVQAYLDRIAAYDKTGELPLNAIQTVNPRALVEADSLDAAMRAKQPRGKLHCVPILLKDQIETKDMPTTYGSSLFKDFVPKRDATAVQRLRAAGAIILAKTSMGEFAGWHVSSAIGVIRNAYDPKRNPSGSSSGSGAGVAANFGLAGIGEDTGGSIRGPASVHALVGLRPTLPLVSRFGMMPANPSQDTMGPMTRTVGDAARVLDVLAGYDPNDPVTAYAYGQVPATYTAALKPDALRGVRVGIVTTRSDSARRAALADTSRAGIARRDTMAIDSAEFAKVRPVFLAAVAKLRELGATVVESLYVNAGGGRFGNNFETEQATDKYLAQHPNAPYKTLKQILLASGNGAVTGERARALMNSIGHSTNEPGYGQLIVNREVLRVEILKLMADNKLDALIYPTYDAQAAEIPADILTRVGAFGSSGYSRGDNRGLSPTLGWPAITVPMGFTRDSVPVGLELLGRPFSEEKLLGYAFGYEQATKHRRPPRMLPAIATKSVNR